MTVKLIHCHKLSSFHLDNQSILPYSFKEERATIVALSIPFTVPMMNTFQGTRYYINFLLERICSS